MLKLVAPISMDQAAQLGWIASAVDALEGIRADEVQAISAELRRSVTRHSQIVPEISRLVAEKRKAGTTGSSLDAINDERVREGFGAIRWVKRDGHTVCELVDKPESSLGKRVA